MCVCVCDFPLQTASAPVLISKGMKKVAFHFRFGTKKKPEGLIMKADA